MEITRTTFDGLFIIIPKVFKDNRGCFFESYNSCEFPDEFNNFKIVQENQSLSIEKGTLRGMKLQTYPYAQRKIIRCIRGKIQDIVVDLRKGSPTYLKYHSIILSAANRKQLFVPYGLAHGFLTLQSNTEILYKEDCGYHPECEVIIRYDDPTFAISWDISGEPITSDKDARAPYYSQIEHKLS